MPTRRKVLGGMLAAPLLPRMSWADVGHPGFLSAARKRDGRNVLHGLDMQGHVAFEIALPTRGHAAAAHPQRPEAVAFARRPGTFAVVLNCATGAVLAQLEAPTGRHFYGHGVFSADGALLFTSENDFDAARGVIGVWDADQGYRRVGEFASGGMGPHDVKLMPDGQSLVVANGGIETHPETGRSKLNLPTMRSSLTYISLDGQMLEEMELPADHQRNSIRHLAVADNGTVAFAMQWQGDLTSDLPLLGMYARAEGRLELRTAASIRHLDGYLGSIDTTQDGAQIAVTSPRRGVLHVFAGQRLQQTINARDICGVAAVAKGFIATTGTGAVHLPNGGVAQHDVSWDNHLVSISA